MTSVSLKVARALSGDGPEALDGLDVLLTQTRAAGDPLREAQVLMRRAYANAALTDGDRNSARADADAAVAILRRLEVQPMLAAAEGLQAQLA